MFYDIFDFSKKHLIVLPDFTHMCMCVFAYMRQIFCVAAPPVVIEDLSQVAALEILDQITGRDLSDRYSNPGGGIPNETTRVTL